MFARGCVAGIMPDALLAFFRFSRWPLGAAGSGFPGSEDGETEVHGEEEFSRSPGSGRSWVEMYCIASTLDRPVPLRKTSGFCPEERVTDRRIGCEPVPEPTGRERGVLGP